MKSADSIEARALWHTSANTSEVRVESLSPCAQEILVRSEFSLISSGTELLVARGGVPTRAFKEMAVPYMGGNFSFPIKYGYSLVGLTDSGNRVHLMHPHQDVCLVAAPALHPLPAHAPSLRGTLLGNMETALTAIWDAQIDGEMRTLVVGFGLVGSLVSRLLRDTFKCQVTVTEINPTRQSIAAQMGFDVALQEEVVRNHYQVSFHTSATSSGLQQAIDSVGHEGKVVELSWYGDRPVSLNLGEEFHYMRKRIISSQVSSIPRHMEDCTFAQRKQQVLEFLAMESFDEHITDVISLSEAARHFGMWRTSPPEGLSYCIKY